jgi:hypothetical protein
LLISPGASRIGGIDGSWLPFLFTQHPFALGAQ